MKKIKIRFTKTTILVIIVFTIMITVFALFFGSYKNQLVEESANHLSEINKQISDSVANEINKDWIIVKSLASTAAAFDNVSFEELKVAYRERLDLLDLNNIFFYTTAGYCEDINGNTVRNDDASQFLYELKDKKDMITISLSSISFAVYIETGINLHGSEIVGISINKELNNFIDNLGIDSFNNTSSIYLVKSNGEKISQLNNQNTQLVFNVINIFENLDIKNIGDTDISITDALNGSSNETYLINKDNQQLYLIITPVSTGWDEKIAIIYIVPESMVNQVMNKFTYYLLGISILYVIIFFIVILLIFMELFKTRRKKYDEAIINREHMLDLLVLNTKNAFLLLTVNQKDVEYTSSNVVNFLNDVDIWLSNEDGHFSIVYHQGYDNPVIKEINTYLYDWDGTNELNTNYIPYFYDKSIHYLVLKAYPIVNEEKKYIFIISDATAEREHERVIKEALKMADTANAAKTKFLANISHDIRTPMNAIINMTKFSIVDINDQEKLIVNLKDILKSSEHLLSLMNDVLDITKIESGDINLSNEPFNLDKCLKDIVNIISPICEKQKRILRTNFVNVKDINIIGDKLKLTQILINILTNAVKYTHDNGEIDFMVYAVDALHSEYESIRFIIKDNGIGISKKYQEVIFEPFVRSEDDKIKEIEGSGLGLAICRSYVLAMGGFIECDSEENRGSTFSVELTFKKTTSNDYEIRKDTINLNEIDFSGKTALLCEDNIVNQKIAKRILESFKFNVDIANNGAEAVKKYQTNPESYAIIYMDIMMPILDGYDATIAIRESEYPNAKTIPIIAMTANVFSNDVEKSRIVGMNAHIGKPIDINNLASVTEKLLGENK